MTQRLIKHPFLAIFDGPDTNSSTDVRSRSTVPLQALYLLNNPFVVENAEGLARRMIAASTDSQAGSPWAINWPGDALPIKPRSIAPSASSGRRP